MNVVKDFWNQALAILYLGGKRDFQVNSMEGKLKLMGPRVSFFVVFPS